MTVKELIAQLQSLPYDAAAVVLHYYENSTEDYYGCDMTSDVNSVLPLGNEFDDCAIVLTGRQ